MFALAVSIRLVEQGAGFGSFRGSGEEPVLAADHKGTNTVFCHVVIWSESSILEIADQSIPLPQGIVDRFAEQSFGRSLHRFLVQPFFEVLLPGSSLWLLQQEPPPVPAWMYYSFLSA